MRPQQVQPPDELDLQWALPAVLGCAFAVFEFGVFNNALKIQASVDVVTEFIAHLHLI